MVRVKNSKYIYVGYGIGCNYESVSAQVKEKVQISFLCDRKWDSSVVFYDKIPVISQSDLVNFKNVKVIIFPCDIPVKNAIAKELAELGVNYIFVEELLGRRRITGKDVKAEGINGFWEDTFQNKIYFHDSLPDEIEIYFNGNNSYISFAENININRLSLYMANDGICEIGANTRIVGVVMHIAYAAVIIGRDCLFASGIMIRTHDAHPIFDRNTHKRINVPKNVIIENHVWVGDGVCLLPGANIGEGSIVGTKTVTSSSFSDHVVIAGVPAKVIRENICWSKDSTECINYSHMDECVTDDALKYC